MSAELLTGVLAEHPVWDGHNDLPWAMRDLVGYDMERIDVAARGERGRGVGFDGARGDHGHLLRKSFHPQHL